VEDKLARKISDPGGKKMPLSEALGGLQAKYKLAIVIAEPKFQEAGRDSPASRDVVFPKVDNRPLSEVLQLILAQVNATYEIVGDDIVVLPAKDKPKP
jgi:hypothetical protein